MSVVTVSENPQVDNQGQGSFTTVNITPPTAVEIPTTTTKFAELAKVDVGEQPASTSYGRSGEGEGIQWVALP